MLVTGRNINNLMVKGVNFFGPLKAGDSIGRAAALAVGCLQAANIPIDTFLLPRPKPTQKIDYGIINEELISTLRHKINIFYMNARRAPLYFSRLPEGAWNGFHNIGCWVHEMQRIPLQWARQFEFFDEIWTPSALCQSAISRYADMPVIKMPYPIEQNKASQRIAERRAGTILPSFNFLTIFDVFSDAERKNPLFTARAFLGAHGGDGTTCLIIKVRNLTLDPILENKLKKIAAENSNIELIDGSLAIEEIDALYNRADAYVSLHRAEGFGLTISDAISRGIPVIVTGYSGSMEFCDVSDTRLVAYDLCPVGHNRPRYRTDDVWAEPDMQDAIRAFREIKENHSVWLAKAVHARARVERDFSIEVVGAMMRERLGLIHDGFSFPDDMTDRCIDVEMGVVNTYGF